MSLLDLASQMKQVLETASVEDYLNANDDPIASRLVFEVARANAILDKNKQKVFMQHITISSRTDAEKAVLAYNNPYFLSLPISLESLAELVQTIKDACATYKVKAPRSWDDVIYGIHSTKVHTVEKQEDEETFRFKPEI